MTPAAKTTPLMTTIRARIATLMAERGWNQGDLAKAVGRKQAWASMVLSDEGKRGLPLTTLEEVAKAFRVDVVELLREPQAAPASLDGFTTVPLLKSPIAAGAPLVVQPDPKLREALAGLPGELPVAVEADEGGVTVVGVSARVVSTRQRPPADIGEGVGELEEQGRGGWEPETWYEGPQVLLVSRYASPR